VHSGAGLPPKSMDEYQAQMAFFNHYGVVPHNFQLAFTGAPGYSIAGVFGTILSSTISRYIDGNDYPVYVRDERARLIVAKRKHTYLDSA
jgi:hypothetical protein